VSNRVEEVDALLGTTTESTYDADDRLLTAGSTTFVHDGRGAQLSISSGVGSTLYGYDDRGLLTSARLPDGTVVSYEVDVLGSRVDANGLSLLVDPFAPTGVPEVLVEHVGGQLTASYTYGTGLISVERGGATFYAHADEIGSVRLATDASGAVVATADYTAFGELLRSTGAMPWPHGFVGERRDANTGLYHLRARQYQPSTGLFTTVDPDVGTLDDPRSDGCRSVSSRSRWSPRSLPESVLRSSHLRRRASRNERSEQSSRLALQHCRPLRWCT
jgi:RHS repeat-associated protein